MNNLPCVFRILSLPKGVICVVFIVFLHPCELFSCYLERTDEGSNRCGPYSVFVALNALGVRESLPSIERQMHWVEGQRTPVYTIISTLKHYSEIDVKQTTLDAKSLKSILENGNVVILLLKKDTNDINHAVCVLRFQNDQLECTEYFDQHYQLSPDLLTSQWNGESILISPSRSHRFSTEWPYLLLPSLAFVIALMRIFSTFQRSQPQSEGEDSR